MMRRLLVGLACAIGFGGCVSAAGCVGHAQVELAAADAIDALAAETQKALDEYDRDLDETDVVRGRELAEAFVARTRRDIENDEEMARHEAAFSAALDRLWQDRETAIRRHGRAGANVTTLKETAAGLRRMGVDALGLEDEARRYVESLLEARARIAAESNAGGPTTQAADGSSN